MQQKSDRKLESCMAQYSFPSVFLAFGAFMISDFIRVTRWRTTYNNYLEGNFHGPKDLVITRFHCIWKVSVTAYCQNFVSQEGAITIQRCFIENQKGAIATDIVQW